MAKNDDVRASLKVTKQKRRNQACKVYEVKVDRPHLNRPTSEHLEMLFLEAKWLYNFTLSQDNLSQLDCKTREVPFCAHGIPKTSQC